ncbi:methicillin resistance protein [Staphylococcus condimenti]|uniref:aminoacyltransferase n=1 Tax=Staphylococcus TaxID=1279 RepID=UPI0008A34B8C|nr:MULTISPECIES: aminoacyltransferase [Staphylococcus]APR59902.1 methicillin resistance protein [Staphylococcus condimenti]MDK8646082.1 aminoacyltransferase [Staphylococcus condimenti]OFP03743.1 methicillin resistance protein [Staphylococcus sp. HMSC065E08]
MEFVTLSSNEFENFTQNHFSHYTQSKTHYEYRDKNQHDVHLVGVKENGEVIAACLLTEARSLKFFKYFYTHRGPVMDFNNLNLVAFFFKNLTAYLKKQNCLFVLVDPYILENIRIANGEIIESKDNRALIQLLDELGYQYQGLTVGYSQTSQIRWLSLLDLKDKSEDTLLKEMDYQTRRNIKKTYEMDVQVRTLPIEETNQFFELFKMAEEKHGFKFREEDYFIKMQKTYGDQAFLKLAYIDLNNLLTVQQQKIDELTQNLNQVLEELEEKPNSKKSKSKRQQLEQQLNSKRKKQKETLDLIESDGPILNLAAALYIYNDHEVYYLSSGSNPKYNAYMGAYRLQWEMIKFAKEHNIDRYNFYGITGDFSEDAEDYGVQKFKEGFNAQVYEYIGDFIKPIKPLFYKIYQRLNENK